MEGAGVGSKVRGPGGPSPLSYAFVTISSTLYILREGLLAMEINANGIQLYSKKVDEHYTR